MPADKVVNWEGGSDARYNTGQMWAVGDGRLTDGTYFYDSQGMPLDAIPGGNEWTNGLPGARGGNSPMSGGGGAAGGLAGSAISSPFYQQALAATQASEAADAANRKAAIQQMLVQFGLVPAGFSDNYGDIDQTTRDLATQNTDSGISISARLKQALQDAQRDSSRRLAARGLRRSGTRGFQMRKNQLGYDQSYSDAVNKVLGSAQGLYSQFAQNQYGRSMSLAQALQNAISHMSSFAPTRSSFSGGGGGAPAPSFSAPSFSLETHDPGARGTPTIGGGFVGDGSPNVSLGGGSGTSSKKPLLF